MSLSRVTTGLRLALESHRNALYSQYVPIEQCRQPKVVINKVAHFGFAIGIILLAALYGTLGLPYESSTQNDNWLQNLATDPSVFTHQIVPQSFWFHFDIEGTLTVTCSIITLLYVAFRVDIGDAFTITQLNNSTFTLGCQVLEKRICKQISRLHRWIVCLTYSLVVSGYILLMTFYLVNVWVNNAYTLTFASFIYWFCFFPLFIFYLIYAILGFQMYIIVSSRIVRIRQDNLLAKLVQLNSSATRRGNSQNSRKATSHKWNRYLKLNGELLNICQHIAQYRQQNVSILSVLVPYLMLAVSYVTTVALFGDRQNLPVCILLNGECTAWLYLITHECAQIDRLNGSLEREMRGFYLNFCAERKGKSKPLPIGAQLKADLFQNSGRLYPYVFSFFGDFRITSKTFHSIIFYTSSYFMFHFKGHSVAI